MMCELTNIVKMDAIKYVVVAPEKIEKKKATIKSIPEGYTLLKTILTGICQSDLRYFFGKRDKDVLKKKYPLCLLHEGIAEVVESKGKFKAGEMVVVIPNIPCYVHKRSAMCSSCRDSSIGENYCEDVKFMSSNCDGMSRTYFLQPNECIVHIPKGVPNDVAVLTELLTVIYRATVEAAVNEKDRVIVFGCGPTGYLMAVFLHYAIHIKKENLYVADIDNSRLDFAKSFSTTVNPNNEAIPPFHFDKAFDCVGGAASEDSIENAFSSLKQKGVLVLLGVSEGKVGIKTRHILEKGLVVKGTTRSPRQDFLPVLNFLKDKRFQDALLTIICKERFSADSAEGLVRAFHKANDPSNYGKVLIKWGG